MAIKQILGKIDVLSGSIHLPTKIRMADPLGTSLRKQRRRHLSNLGLRRISKMLCAADKLELSGGTKNAEICGRYHGPEAGNYKSIADKNFNNRKLNYDQ